MSRLALVGLLAAAQLGLAIAEVGCEWVAEASTCTAVSHMAGDSSADSLLSDAGTCIENTASGMQGCEEDLPQCEAVTVAGFSSFGICIPALAVVGALDVSEAESLFEIEDCAGIASDECNQVRETYYGLLGCPECIPEANAAAVLESTCAAAASEEECAATSALATGDPVAPPEDDVVEDPYAVYDAVGPVVEDPYNVYEAPVLDDPFTYTYDDVVVPAAAPVDTYSSYDEGADGIYEGTFEGVQPYSYGYAYEPYYDSPAPEPATYYYSYTFYTDSYGAVPAPVAVDALAPVPAADAYATPYAYPDTYYFPYDYPAAYDEVLGPAVVVGQVPLPAPEAIAPLDLESIDVTTVTEAPGPIADPYDDPVEDTIEGPEGVTTEDVREFINPVLSDRDADAPATVLLEPFAAAGPGRLSSAALPLLSLIAALACMLA